MTISIAPELEAQVRQRAQWEGISVEAYLERLILEDEDWGECSEIPLEEDEAEFADIQASVMEGMEQAERGEFRPADEVFRELRAKHGL